jgi:hypothetical protein
MDKQLDTLEKIFSSQTAAGIEQSQQTIATTRLQRRDQEYDLDLLVTAR